MPNDDYDPDYRPLEALAKIPPRPGLQLVQQASRWTCMAASFAMVLSAGKPGQRLYHDIVEQLGRDDERGYHVQEFLGIAVTLGAAFVPFEFEPLIERAPCHWGEWRDGECVEQRQISVYGDSDWFPCGHCGGSGVQPPAPMVLWPLSEVMRRHDGVLLGKRKGASHHHAVAWCKETQLCLDPEAGEYGLDNFQPMTFWARFWLVGG